MSGAQCPIILKNSMERPLLPLPSSFHLSSECIDKHHYHHLVNVHWTVSNYFDIFSTWGFDCTPSTGESWFWVLLILANTQWVLATLLLSGYLHCPSNQPLRPAGD